MTIKAIETRYAGCAFRSRLEARWAVFFDELGIEWEYEPQGFEVADDALCWSDGGRYLPDFYLPKVRSTAGPQTHQIGLYVEVKGSDDQADPRKLEVIADLIDFGGPLAKGLLLLGPLPDPRTATIVSHMVLKHEKGVRAYWTCFATETLMVESPLRIWCPNDGYPVESDMGRATWEAQAHRVLDASREREWRMGPTIQSAYEAARSARFEHGHSGAVR